MKREFTYSLLQALIKDRDFMPLQDAEGKYSIYDKINILTKDAYGALVIVELLDGDSLTSEEIEERLRGNQNIIYQIEEGIAQYIYEVFIFSSYPEQDKLNVIKAAQYQKAKDRKYIKCLSVNLENKSVERYFKLPLTDEGISKNIKAIMKQGISREIVDVDIEEVVMQKRNEFHIKLEAKTPILSYALIALNVIIWIALSLYSAQSGTNFNELLLKFGAKENTHILSGEYWRFITPVFLHFDIPHLVLNCYSLYALNIVERVFGHVKFLAVYLIAGIMGNIASFLFSMGLGAGASGAIFGLLGSLLYFGLQRPTLFKAYFGANVFVMIFINLAYGFSRSGIDNFAHIGGLIGGFLATGAVSASDKTKWYLNRFIYIAVTIVIVVSSLFYGFGNPESKITLKVNEMEELDKNQNWNEVIKAGKEILALNPKSESNRISVYWTLAKAQGMTGEFDDAVENAKKLVEIDPTNGRYILGLLYHDMGQFEKARDELLEAKKLMSDKGNGGSKEIISNIDSILRNMGY
ncbi:rhomboid family intramembrane serine protease [Pseudobacteroides cellulosolvens]|uniref:Peptidase S54, rhomboid domain containing protein n=1 Tax=Pseudobacteroides cellulosolvens ATCC 35603 = DSM 2933 TaxID=398512 RepID=A0A0L6JVR2_9FIRM|nr:rhomboid family intramembrane serine protease [Pseudobacteroides cellulosolvens]KNY29928.1 Peptidase S54, rhomboid domain containing protein [Pseudobacteroides cellulosolvens ATCC 35603 = DSM 2933]